jgi:hypothetical protein
LIKSTPILILLLMIFSLGLTLSPPKQVWAISESTTDIITSMIETFGPMLGPYLNPENPENDESGPTGNPPIESPAPLGPGDPCADPALADLCGGPPGWNDPCADPALADLCGGSPQDPLLVMQRFWGNFELQLSYLAPQYQQAVLSELRLMIEQGLAPYPPEQQQEAIQMLQQTMSPELSEMVLPT